MVDTIGASRNVWSELGPRRNLATRLFASEIFFGAHLVDLHPEIPAQSRKLERGMALLPWKPATATFDGKIGVCVFFVFGGRWVIFLGRPWRDDNSTSGVGRFPRQFLETLLALPWDTHRRAIRRCLFTTLPPSTRPTMVETVENEYPGARNLINYADRRIFVFAVTKTLHSGICGLELTLLGCSVSSRCIVSTAKYLNAFQRLRLLMPTLADGNVFVFLSCEILLIVFFVCCILLSFCFMFFVFCRLMLVVFVLCFLLFFVVCCF